MKKILMTLSIAVAAIILVTTLVSCTGDGKNPRFGTFAADSAEWRFENPNFYSRTYKNDSETKTESGKYEITGNKSSGYKIALTPLTPTGKGSETTAGETYSLSYKNNGRHIVIDGTTYTKN